MSKWSLSHARPFGRTLGAANPRLRILIWATIAGLIFGAIEAGKPLENGLRNVRSVARSHPASGDIAIVAIDENTQEDLNVWPWPRGRYAQLIDGLKRLGARRVFIDIQFSWQTSPHQDSLMEAALARSDGRVTLATRSVNDPITGDRASARPIPAFRKHAEMANIEVSYDYGGWVWRLPYAQSDGSGVQPSFAAKLANVRGVPQKTFPIDYSIEPTSIPSISAIDVIQNAMAPGSLAGKDVIVGTTSPQLGDLFFLPVHGRRSGVYLHALGAETLKAGVPTVLGWVPAFLFAFVVAAWCMRVGSLARLIATSTAGAALLLGVPLLLENQSIHADVVPGLFLLLTVSVALIWSNLRRSYRVRGTVNSVSGLANLDALRALEVDHERILIAARIHNYPQIASALPPGAEQDLIAQIANRLTLGKAGAELYQGDEGIFAWFSDQPTIEAVGEHLDALHGFFRNSVAAGDKQIDLTLSFGVDSGHDRSLSNRLGSALVACDEAAVEGLRWKIYDPAALKDVAWKLSLLGQLDRAIDNGDFWVAYQPKLDLATGEIVGAEALARWTHPEKGAIAPLDFIIAAEQSDRIDKLTRFVLDHAIEAAASINRVGVAFDISVNLSARLINDPGFVDVVDALLAKHGLSAARLTLEVTETAALQGVDEKLVTLDRLRERGVGISIDDYGTGLSTLDYLKRIPATEIKIDQSFVGAITRSQSDRLMVHSTLQLAHSLGQIVVAEGVEDQATLDALIAMGCDQAQGFFIGRPTTLYAFTERLLADRNVKVPRNAVNFL